MSSSHMRDGVPHPVPIPTNTQAKSPLFSKLPIEIRRHIYQQLCLDCGLTQHIIVLHPKSYVASFPCILSPEELNQVHQSPDDDNGEPDQRATTPHDDLFEDYLCWDGPGDINSALEDCDDGYNPADDNVAGSAPWCMHCKCFDRWSEKWGRSSSGMHSAYYRREGRCICLPHDLRTSTVLAAFLVCRRVYEEASDSFFSSVRFSFGSSTALETFLGQVPPPLASRVRSTDIVAADLECIADEDHIDDRPYAQQVYEIVRASFPNLQELCVTLHPKRYTVASVPQKQDLEPLYALAREMDSLRRFEVFLPTKREWRDGKAIGYGEVHSSLEDAPFTVKAVLPNWHDVSECLPFHSPV